MTRQARGSDEVMELRRALLTGAALAMAGGPVTVAVALFTRSHTLEQYNFEGVLASGIAAVAGGFLLLGGARRPAPWMPPVMILAFTITISAGIYHAGPDLPLGGVFYLWLVVWTFLYRPVPTAVATLVLIGTVYGIVLAAQELAVPAAVWMFMMATAAMTGVTISSLVRRADALAESEHQARTAIELAHTELSTWSRTLEERVEEQVAALEALSGLRRFLSTPVVDALLSSDRRALLQPHRRQIAVFFCDLRGFTAFSASAQPEEVDAVLGDYFELLGRHVNRHAATVGGFTGDGLMAFFNDPLPIEDPVFQAVSMATEIRREIQDLLGRWRRQGFELGIGFGIAYGYANIGMIGFDGRQDYSALGPVVNLASRLCAEAHDQEILIDTRAHAASGDLLTFAGERHLDLKGYTTPVAAHSVAAIGE